MNQRMLEESEPVQLMKAFILRCCEHKKYGEVYNFEDLAKTEFQKKGRGCVWLSATEYVSGILTGDKSEFNLKHNYATLQELEAQQVPIELIERIHHYNPNQEYVLMQMLDSDALPTKHRNVFPGQYLTIAEYVRFSLPLKPTSLNKQQIRKRLNRMIQQGKKLLIADTSHPDFMGENLQKWMRTVSQLQNEGKNINLIIDSEDETPYQNLPDDLKADVVPITFK